MKLIAQTPIRRGTKDDGVENIAEGQVFESEKGEAERLIAYGAALPASRGSKTGSDKPDDNAGTGADAGGQA